VVNGSPSLAGVGVVEPSAHLFETRVRGWLVDEVVEADQPRHIEHALVHLPALGAPRDAVVEFVEQPVGVREPAGAHLDPRAVAEVATFGVFKQRAL
jgi:hypothetical protein